MIAPVILETLQSAGLTLTLTATHGLKVVPASRLTDPLRAQIRAHLGELKDWLNAANDRAPGSETGTTDPRIEAPMTEIEIAAFTTRVLDFMGEGLAAREAEALADKLVQRDREGDDRQVCFECRFFKRGRCDKWRELGMGAPELGKLARMLQRCPGFEGINNHD